jgi:hypothetical protein
MNTYTATFADGTTITRKTKREYAVAWRATWTRDNANGEQQAIAYTGFAVTKDRASPTLPVIEYAPGRGCFGSSANERARVRKVNEDWRRAAGYRVEFAPAVKL